MDLKLLKYEVKGKVGIITINRPDVLNAIDEDVIDEMNGLLDDIEKDLNIGCIIITGEGRAFSAGGDIAHELKQDCRGAYHFSRIGAQITSRLEGLRVPVIGAINGYALGGGLEFALACDLRIAADTPKAILGMPEITLAVFPGWGGTQRLPRLIGKSRAMEMIFGGKPITPAKALEIGLVNKVVPADKLMEEALTMADDLAAKAPLAIANVKKAIHIGLQTDLDRGLEIESALFGPLYGTEDQHEAMTAFLEKRKPNPFKGR